MLLGSEAYPLEELFQADPAGYGRIRYAACPAAEIAHENVVRLLFFGALIYLSIGIRIVKPDEWLVVMRLGKYCGFRKQGIHWVVPFVDKTVRVNLSQVSPRWKDTPDQILETKVHEWISARSPS